MTKGVTAGAESELPRAARLVASRFVGVRGAMDSIIGGLHWWRIFWNGAGMVLGLEEDGGEEGSRYRREEMWWRPERCGWMLRWMRRF